MRIVPQARAGVVERLGRYARTLDPGLTLIVPFIDRVKPLIDLREQVVTFPPQPVITEDNLVVGIDTVIYFTVTDPKAATYEVANPLQAIEQLTVTTLRNVIGGLTLEETLTSRDNINSQLRVVLDEATGKWGIRVNRVELKSVEPPRTVQEAMEKQMRAERDRRAAILTAEGVKQSQILTAEGEKQAAVLKAEGARTSAILRAEGESKAIETVFQAIHDGAPDEQLLSYQYLQMLPQLAQGSANKIFIIPSEFNQALGNLGGALSSLGGGSTPPKPKSGRNEGADAAADAAAADARSAADAARAAEREASAATTESRLRPGMMPGEIGPGAPPEQGDPPPPPPPPPEPPPGLEVADGAVRAAFEQLAGQFAEPALDEVQPGARGRREVQTKRGCAVSHLRIAGVLWVELLSSTRWTARPADLPVDRGQKLLELDRAMAAVQGADDLAAGHVQGVIEAGGPVALVVVRGALEDPGQHRQDRRGAVERLDLGLLIDAEHDGALGRR